MESSPEKIIRLASAVAQHVSAALYKNFEPLGAKRKMTSMTSYKYFSPYHTANKCNSRDNLPDKNHHNGDF